jgi:hypothetical protein
MPFCDINGNTGFIQLRGTISQSTLNSKKISGSHPIQLQVGPRSTPPSISGKQINDLASNSCSFRTNATELYTLVDIKICSPLHTGYNLPDMNGTPSAEMILSFSRDHKGVLLCLPLFNTNRSDNDAYLNEVIDQTQTTSIVTFDSMFVNQPSIGYTTCFEKIDSQSIVQTGELHIFVFPKGIHLSDSMYQKLMTKVGTLVVYNLPPAIRDFLPTVSASTIVNGSKQISSQSTDGQIPIVQIESCNIGNIFTYHVQGPSLSNQSSSSNNTVSSGSTPSQYKCVPFSKYITQHPTDPALKDVIASYNNTVKADDSSILDPKNILIMEATIASTIAFTAIAGLVYAIYKITNISD